MRIVSKILALLLLVPAARAEYTNFVLYGWSSDVWPTDNTNNVRHGYSNLFSWVNIISTNNLTVQKVTGSVTSSVNSKSYGSSLTTMIKEESTQSAIAGTHDYAMGFNAKDLRSYEAFIALYERAAFANFIIDGGPSSDEDFCDQTIRYHRYEHSNLEHIKEIIFSMAEQDCFADISVATNPIQTGAVTPIDLGVYSGRVGTIIPYITEARLTVMAQAPSNVLTYTPGYRSLDGHGRAYHRIDTNTWTVSTTNNWADTNDVTTTWGDAYRIVGTNGQVVVGAITNLNIQSGFTDKDYGWRHIPKMISLLSWVIVTIPPEGRTVEDWASGDDVEWWHGDGTNPTSWATAKDDAETQYNQDFGDSAYDFSHYTFGGSIEAIGGEELHAYEETRTRRIDCSGIDAGECYGLAELDYHESWAPGSAIMEVYAYATPVIGRYENSGAGAPADVADWDAYGTSLVGSNQYYAIGYDSFSPGDYQALLVNMVIEFGSDDEPRPWTDEPVVTPGVDPPPPLQLVETTSRGFSCDLSTSWTLIRPTFTFGATFGSVPGLTTTSTSSSSSTTSTSTTTSTTTTA